MGKSFVEEYTKGIIYKKLNRIILEKYGIQTS